MGLDCRDLLDVKEYEFLINWFMRKQKQHQLAQLQEPYSYDGFSEYDQKVNQLIAEATIAFVETFHRQAPALVFTNLFHLAELELQGKRDLLIKAPKKLQ
ncbi:hypothetical protein [Rheinheimera soli]|jgi:hypothetical protein|uniref:Uncharacterized protein n=1 Tax=Rheinheimera soli TaxID=443616 RepID=A0ABU1VUS3_9GAMM|nr:hypothetical protein [Rheinheimera soli]MDR7119469.1 hypothetical protein [Rheinheimera soli]